MRTYVKCRWSISLWVAVPLFVVMWTGMTWVGLYLLFLLLIWSGLSRKPWQSNAFCLTAIICLLSSCHRPWGHLTHDLPNASRFQGRMDLLYMATPSSCTVLYKIKLSCLKLLVGFFSHYFVDQSERNNVSHVCLYTNYSGSHFWSLGLAIRKWLVPSCTGTWLW